MATDALSRQDLEQLATRQGDPCVSIFLPTHRVSLDTEQDRIRLDNLLSAAGKKLKEQGVRHAQDLLRPGTALLHDPEFWRHQDDGLALFISDGFSARYRLPLELSERLHIGNTFQVKPLLPLLSGNGIFYLLCLSQNQVGLYRASKQRMEPVDIPELPESLAWALRFDEQESQLQLHSGTGGAAGAQGDRAAMFHGHGVGTDDEKDRVERFCRKVDKGLSEYLTPRKAPLVLAAVENVASIFKEVSTYQGLVPQVVEGNPRDLSSEQLHNKAWEAVRQEFERPRTEALDRYQRLAGTGKTGAGLEEVLPAAAQGKVDSLFAAGSAEAFGTFDAQSFQVDVHGHKGEGDLDLMDEACRQTLLKGGDVYILPADQVPGEEEVAAVYRF